MKCQPPFLDVRSFVTEETTPVVHETSALPSSPFLSLYESEEGDGLIDPASAEYVEFLNELHDEEFDETLSTLVDEARAIFETQFEHEQGDPQAIAYQAERLLEQHFAPLASETEGMIGTLARELGQRDPSTLTGDEIETVVDRYQPAVELSPSFEEFLGKLKKAVKKVAKKAVSVAKKGITAVATGGISLILPKLKPLIKPLLKRVIQFAIGKLPASLQPFARKLAQRLPFLKELEEGLGIASEPTEISEIGLIQDEFNQHLAGLLFARTEVEQDLEIAEVLTEQAAPDTYPLAALNRARDGFVENLRQLKEGEDPTPHIESFLPAILPALRVGIRLIGRKKIVDFLANLLGKLIKKFVGPQHTPALSQAIVDAGLRLIQLEATPEDESRAAASAVAATVEETVRRVADAPDYVLDNQELFEGFALEAFEQAAATNLPPILPEETYRRRPDLTEVRRLRGTWVMMPRGRGKRYKKFSRKVPIRLQPHKVSALETFEGIHVDEFLEEQLGIDPGEEVEAFIHLYEALPGTRLSDIKRLDENTLHAGSTNGHDQLHPLTREAAALLLGEPQMGRGGDSQHLLNPHTPMAGERFYYLEIPGRRPLTATGPSGRSQTRRPTQLRLILDFPRNEVRVYLFLGERRAQEIAVKLRQHAHLGMVMTRLRRFLDRGMRRVFSGAPGRLKIVHEAVTPDQWTDALRRLPSFVPQVLRARLQEWILQGLFDHLRRQAQEFTVAAEDTADGVTLAITLGNPPGLPQLREALRGKGLPLAGWKLSDGAPTVTVKISPGYTHE